MTEFHKKFYESSKVNLPDDTKSEQYKDSLNEVKSILINGLQEAEVQKEKRIRKEVESEFSNIITDLRQPIVKKDKRLKNKK